SRQAGISFSQGSFSACGVGIKFSHFFDLTKNNLILSIMNLMPGTLTHRRIRSDLQMQIFQLLVIDRCRSIDHDITSHIVFGKGDKVPYGVSTVHHSAKSVQAKSNSAVGRSAVFKCVHQKTKLFFCFFRSELQQFKILCLEFPVVYPDRSSSDFRSIDDQVVGVCPDGFQHGPVIGSHFGYIGRFWRSKRMMHRIKSIDLLSHSKRGKSTTHNALNADEEYSSYLRANSRRNVPNCVLVASTSPLIRNRISPCPPPAEVIQDRRTSSL